MSAVRVHCLTQKTSLFGLRTLELGLGKQFNLSGQALYGLEFDELLGTKLGACSLDLFNTR